MKKKWFIRLLIFICFVVLISAGCGGGGGGGSSSTPQNEAGNNPPPGENNQNPPPDQGNNPPPDVKTAGVIKLPKTGQIKCYDTDGTEIDCKGTGQDGEIQAGVAWPDQRFTDNGDGTVTDNLTGLMWLKDANLKGTRSKITCVLYCPPPGAELWNDAARFVLALNKEKYAGYSDWRMPNINELESLLDLGRYGFTFPVPNPFVHMETGFYWSSTIHNPFPMDEPLNTWVTYFYSGITTRIENRYGDRGFVWPTRTAEDKLVKIPQTDGDEPRFRNGVVWPDPRFIDNKNGTITDALTGLVWTKNMNVGKNLMTWPEALVYVAKMNIGEYPNFGYTDWRLPNRKELESLQYYHTLPPWLWGDKSIFTNYPAKSFWTSTSHIGNTKYAWSVILTGTYVGNNVELNEKGKPLSYVWPVR